MGPRALASQGKAKKDIATTDTKPSPVGENVPAITETKPAVDPNPDFHTKKLAGEAKVLADRAAALLNPKSASTPAATPAAAAPKVATVNPDNQIPTGDLSFHFKIASFVLENEATSIAIAYGTTSQRELL